MSESLGGVRQHCAATGSTGSAWSAGARDPRRDAVALSTQDRRSPSLAVIFGGGGRGGGRRLWASRLDVARARHSGGHAQLRQNPSHQHEISCDEKYDSQPLRHMLLDAHANHPATSLSQVLSALHRSGKYYYVILEAFRRLPGRPEQLFHRIARHGPV